MSDPGSRPSAVIVDMSGRFVESGGQGIGGGGGGSGGAPPPIAPPPGPPQNGDMEEIKRRVTGLEASTRAMEIAMATLMAKFDAAIPTLATKADVLEASRELPGLATRMGTLEGTVRSKLLGLPAILTLMLTMLAVISAISNVTAGRAPWQFTSGAPAASAPLPQAAPVAPASPPSGG